MVAEVLQFPLHLVRPPATAYDIVVYQCSLPCFTALDYGPEICMHCEYAEPLPPESA